VSDILAGKLRDAHMALKRKDKKMAELKLKAARLAALRERVIAVRELHKRSEVNNEACGLCTELIQHEGLFVVYPCPTIQALDGEEL
jgi:hypothetical protein